MDNREMTKAIDHCPLSNVHCQFRPPKILVAGVGNIFHGDDAFGCEVISFLQTLELPENVSVRDFGIRGIDLAFEIAADYDLIVLADCLDAGATPGTLVTLEPRTSDRDSSLNHDMTPASALEFASQFGKVSSNVILIGCQPAKVAFGSEMSDPVRNAIPRAAEKIVKLITEFRAD